jgi:hypothetical protein
VLAAFLLAGCGGSVSFDVAAYPRTSEGVADAFARALAAKDPDTASFYVARDADFVLQALPSFVGDFADHRTRIVSAKPREVVFAVGHPDCGKHFRTRSFVDVDLGRESGRWVVTAIAIDVKADRLPQRGC